MWSEGDIENAKYGMWKRNVCERKREIWNVFKVCKSEMWKRNAKVFESEKRLSKYKWSILMVM